VGIQEATIFGASQGGKSLNVKKRDSKKVIEEGRRRGGALQAIPEEVEDEEGRTACKVLEGTMQSVGSTPETVLFPYPSPAARAAAGVGEVPTASPVAVGRSLTQAPTPKMASAPHPSPAARAAREGGEEAGGGVRLAGGERGEEWEGGPAAVFAAVAGEVPAVPPRVKGRTKAKAPAPKAVAASPHPPANKTVPAHPPALAAHVAAGVGEVPAAPPFSVEPDPALTSAHETVPAHHHSPAARVAEGVGEVLTSPPV